MAAAGRSNRDDLAVYPARPSRCNQREFLVDAASNRPDRAGNAAAYVGDQTWLDPSGEQIAGVPWRAIIGVRKIQMSACEALQVKQVIQRTVTSMISIL